MLGNLFFRLKRACTWRLLMYACLTIGAVAAQPCLVAASGGAGAGRDADPSRPQASPIRQESPNNPQEAAPSLETSAQWNRRLQRLLDEHAATRESAAEDYQIGFFDVLDIGVFEAPELNRRVRVSAGGEISLPLLGSVPVAGLTPRELELNLQELLKRTYMKDPHVSVFVRDVQSHPVSVMGAVRKPGVFQVQGAKSLLEILSLAEGLSDDAGDTVIILREGGLRTAAESASQEAAGKLVPARLSAEKRGPSEPSVNSDSTSREEEEVNLKELLDSSDPDDNPMVYPGDIVKVTRAGIVYVVGDVQRPGGFTIKSNDKMSVIQAIALSGGVLRTAAKGHARIIRTQKDSGKRTEIPINLGRILAGQSPDPILEARDILFVPNSAAKTVFSRGVEAAAQTMTGILIFHW